MHLLLDTSAFLWWITDDQRLGTKTRDKIAGIRNIVYISVATIWEIAEFLEDGAIEGNVNLTAIIEEEGFEPLNIDSHHGQLAGSLSMPGKNRFNRMLLAQAQAEGLTLVTPATEYRQKGIRTWDASL